MGSTHFTEEQTEWIRQNFYLVSSYAELTDKFNAKFGTSRKTYSISDKCSKRMHLTGMHNSSQYGNKPHEQLPIGTIRKNQVGTYIKVKEIPLQAPITSGYSEPYWLPLQKKIYQDAYGEIQKGQMICFLDKNTENFSLDNLYCIDRKISALMSVHKWWTDSKEHTLTAIKWCELYLTLKELNKKGKRNERINSV